MEALGISPIQIFVQVINFGVVIWILWMLLYKPVTKMLNDRTARIEASLREADQMRQQLASARSGYEAEIAKARQEAGAIVSQAQERAKAQEAEIIAQARREADRLREEARAQAGQERDQMLREAKSQIAELVTLTASRVLGAELQSRGHDQLIEESLAALGRPSNGAGNGGRTVPPPRNPVA